MTMIWSFFDTFRTLLSWTELPNFNLNQISSPHVKDDSAFTDPILDFQLHNFGCIWTICDPIWQNQALDTLTEAPFSNSSDTCYWYWKEGFILSDRVTYINIPVQSIHLFFQQIKHVIEQNPYYKYRMQPKYFDLKYCLLYITALLIQITFP